MKRLALFAGICLSALVLAAPAQATTINFDDVANGTVIDTHYLGVTFSNGLDGSDIYARDAFAGTNTGNVVSVLSTAESPTGPFNAQYGAVDGTFDSAVGRVSIDVTNILNSGDLLGNTPLKSYLQVFSGTTLLATVYSTLPLGSGEIKTETLSYTSATDNITGFRLSAQYDSTGSSGTALFSEFDNLSFDARLASGQFPSTGVTNPVPGGDTGGGGGTQVPEPATLVLMAIGGVFSTRFGNRRKSAAIA